MNTRPKWIHTQLSFLYYKIIIENVNKLSSPLKAILVEYSFSLLSYFELNISMNI